VKNETVTGDSDWTFLSNHAHVLLCIAAEPEIRLREVAEQVGITERAVQRIVADLSEGGYLSREREGRRNHYEVHAERPLRHPIEAHCDIRALLAMVLGCGGRSKPESETEST
jgi:predicted transcriptional regulator